MSAKSSLRNLVLTPERIPSFFIPSRNPLLSPLPLRSSNDWTRLLSDHDDDSPGSNSPAAPRPCGLQRLPAPRMRRPCTRSAATESVDADLTTRAAMSLPHVDKVTTPYGFSAVLAASPCTSRRESLFHRNKKVTVTVTNGDVQEPVDTTPPPSTPPGRSRVCLRPVRALGLQVVKELKKPVAMLKALSPAHRR